MGKSLSKYQMSSPDGASNHVTPDDIAVTSLAAKFTTSFSSPDKPRPITCTNDTHNDTTTLERDRQCQNEHAKKLSSQVRDRENVKDSRTSSEVSGGKSYKEMMDRDRSRCQEKYARQAEFGIGCWRPRRLQCLAKTLWTFIFLYGPCAVWLVTAGQYVRTQVTSMERHFRVNSSKMGILLSTNDIGSLIFVLLGSHFGKFRHIPRVLALSALATGLFLMALSLIQAITPTYLPKGDTSTSANITNTSQTDDQDRYLCHNQNPDRNQTNITSEEVQGSDNDDVTVSTHWGFYLTCFLLFAVGASVSYRLSLQTCYIERNIRHKAQSGMMLGVLVTAMVFGSPISLLLGGAMNALPVDMGDSKMDIYDPRWISAWWLGFLIIGACAAVLSLPVFLLPRYIIYDEDSTGAGSCCGKKPTPPEDNSAVITDSGVWRDVTEEDVSKQESRDPTSDKDREKSAPGDEEHDGESNFLDQVKDLPRSVMRILVYPVIPLLLIEWFLTMAGISGSMAFQLKYIENQFDIPASSVSYYLGYAQLASSVLGTFLGGFLITRLHLSTAGMFKLCWLGQMVAMCSSLSFIFMDCPSHDIQGFNVFDRNLSQADCACSASNILFVCGSDGRNYISPCVAGCERTEGLKFEDCQLLEGAGSASPGLCERECSLFIPFIIIYNVLVFAATFSLTPRVLMMARSVQGKDQPLVTGFMEVVSTVGSMVGPIVFGDVIDSTCILWPVQGGQCLLFSKDQLRLTFLGTEAIIRGAGMFLLTIATIIAHVQQNCRARRDASKKEKAEKEVCKQGAQAQTSLDNSASRDRCSCSTGHGQSDTLSHTGDDHNSDVGGGGGGECDRGVDNKAFEENRDKG